MELICHKQYCMFLILFIGFLCDTVSIGCNSRLLADRILVPDTSFQHSSAATLQHGASAAREDPNDLSLQERAWCPDAKVGKELREFMEIDLGRQSIIKLIITKGRVAQSKRLAGNQDAMTENFNTMDPPFVARYIRIYPYSLEPTKTCLKLELLGCEANGILEYKAPEGALLPETISPSHQQYNNNPSNERTRLLDTTYDSKSHKFRLFDNIQQDFIHDLSYQTIIEGGLGKLTDNDTEFKTIGLTIPRNITVGFSFQDPSLYYYRHYGQSRQQKTDQQQEQHEEKNPWSSSILYQLTPDKQNTDSRWIVLPIHEVIRSNYAIQAITKQVSHNPGQLIQNNSDVEQLNIFGLGQFVEIRIFFNSQWLAVGEILFENCKFMLE
ncbi:putative discoidin domain receptor [Schistosoma mansoni]|uniref:putative discoidin domain receptor n=1 Tax=Schistosoma mansoni TaxID=6183 RepID=UPI00022DCC0C|nr:putative discoidin domain receptor [Schistosoma mansoni]|eukprot:XP_018655103.1 putative discoidin domain receptor [Schistosoma mansoni]